MASFTLEQLGQHKGVSADTMRTYLRKIKFKKTSIGRNYSETEAWNISQKLDFTIPELNGSNVPIAERAAKDPK